MNHAIVELDLNEIENVSGGPLPLAIIPVIKVVAAAATSSTGKAIFAGTFAAGVAAAVAVGTSN